MALDRKKSQRAEIYEPEYIHSHLTICQPIMDIGKRHAKMLL